MKSKWVYVFTFVLALLLVIGTVITTNNLPIIATSYAQYSYALDSQGEQEIGQVIADPIPIPVFASGSALLSRIDVQVLKGRGWAEYREAIISSINPPRIGDPVQCLTYYDYHGGTRIRRTTTVCNSATEEH